MTNNEIKIVLKEAGFTIFLKNDGYYRRDDGGLVMIDLSRCVVVVQDKMGVNLEARSHSFDSLEEAKDYAIALCRLIP